MQLNDIRLNELARELLVKLIKRKTEEERVEFLKDLLFTIPVKHIFLFDPQLSTREMTCLYFAAKGLTSHETAKLLAIKTSTVEAHRKEILRKLACNNMVEAVFRGISYGYFGTQNFN